MNAISVSSQIRDIKYTLVASCPIKILLELNTELNNVVQPRP
jgi:hypothetical protein